MSNKVSNRKWRNPYAPIPSKKLSDQVENVSLSISPKRILPAVDLRTSVSKMRHNIKGIGSTIRQVEDTMDSLYGAMEMIENLGKRTPEPEVVAEKPAGKRKAAPEPQKAAETTTTTTQQESGLGNLLANIDIGQLLGLLQSPLVQNLITQVSSSSKERKKEG
ncbi:hypothetical protein E8L90_10475 [Brevibacillus antibioticus]|uniref:Uncharacterized protein n=1 Tax=Brevibacillus antibioticus TaxID=2570228 RepID=A0A4U2Y5K1_9BACL|nr:hypothetical protein [Brevibacillus antibioticus]TKI55836.1 hypothetical protein E8L90_10475 [Brevibacillus antibioticus]